MEQTNEVKKVIKRKVQTKSEETKKALSKKQQLKKDNAERVKMCLDDGMDKCTEIGKYIGMTGWGVKRFCDENDWPVIVDYTL